MKKVKMIINPSSGRQVFQKKIDTISLLLLNNGYTVSKYYTEKKNDAKEHTVKCCSEDWDLIVACGGDGTINEIANGIAIGGRKIPVAIFASGTVNDFASILKLPNDPYDFFDLIKRFNYTDVDLGKYNNTYYVNVAAGGFIINVAHETPNESKTALGRMAYYLQGVKEFPKVGFNSKKIKIISKEYNSEDDIILFLITNSSQIGGFKKLAPLAHIEDGYLDCLVIKKSDVPESISIFFNILSGKHIKHPNVTYFKTKEIYIESNDDIKIDVDGEYGGKLPGRFKIVPKAFRIII